MNKLLAILAISFISLSANADFWAWDYKETVSISETISWSWDDDSTALEYNEESSWSWK